MLGVKAVVVLTIAALIASVSCDFAKKCRELKNADVLILGAGLAGLGAARRLSREGVDFLVIEGRETVGGRIQSGTFAGQVVEFGPQLLENADLSAPPEIQNPLLPYFERCGITLNSVPAFSGPKPVICYNNRGEDITEQVFEGFGRLNAAVAPDKVRGVLSTLPDDVDITAAEGLRIGGWDPCSQLEEHVERVRLPLGANTDFASYRHLFDPDLAERRQSQFGSNPNNYLVINPVTGFQALPQCIADEIFTENDDRLLLNTTVTQLLYGEDCVCALTESGTKYCATYAILTFSLGVLNKLSFDPPLPPSLHSHLNQFEQVDHAKLYALFENTFWDIEPEIITYNDEERGADYFPLFKPWGAFFRDAQPPYGPPILEAFLGGETAKRVANQDKSITIREIGRIVRNIYGANTSDPIDVVVGNLIKDPKFEGAYSVAPVGLSSRAFDEVTFPIEQNLYLSGEAFSRLNLGTPHGAFLNGDKVAGEIATKLTGPIQIVFKGDTPRVEGRNLIANFKVLRPVESIECVINKRPRIDCSSGEVNITDLDDGQYELRVIAKSATGPGIGRASRRVRITSGAACSAHLINKGVKLVGRRARLEFASSGLPVTGYRCSLDNGQYRTCASPLILRNLTLGRHRLRISPVCAGASTRVAAVFEASNHSKPLA